MEISQSEFESNLESLRKNTYSNKSTTFLVESIISSRLEPRDFFRRIVNFGDDKILAARHGGGFACEHQLSGETPRAVELYDNNLKHILSLFTEPNHGSLSAFYYSVEEMLICIFTNRACVYNQRGAMVDNVKLFELQPDEFFEFAVFHDFGFFVVTGIGNVYYVSSYQTFKCEWFSKINIDDFDNISGNASAAIPPNKVVYINGEASGYGPILWIAASKNKNNFLISVQKDRTQVLPFMAKIHSIKCSPDFSKMALIASNQIYIFNRNCTKCFSVINIPEIGMRIVNWCASDNLLVSAQNKIILINKSNEVLSIPMDVPYFVVPEIDGARIITDSDVFYIREIYGPALNLVDRNNISPAIKLIYDLSEKLIAAETDLAHTINRPFDLNKALSQCLNAIFFFRNNKINHYLLDKVVKYKSNLKQFDFQRFSNIVTSKRVIEQLAKDPIQIQLTNAQLLTLGYDRLLMRLCNRFQHFIAFRIADYLNVSSEQLYTNWAHSLIFSSASNEEIIKTLSNAGHSFDYVQLADAAYNRNKFMTISNNNDSDKVDSKARDNVELAKALIDMNAMKSRSVPLLIKWKQWDRAIEAAVQSNNSSLLKYTLKTFQQEISSQTYLKGDDHDLNSLKKLVDKTLLNNPIALKVWISLNPDDPSITDLLIKSGNKKKAINREFISLLDSINEKSHVDYPCLIEKTQEINKKANKSGESFGIQYTQSFSNMLKLCMDLNIKYVEAPIEAIDEVIKANGNIHEARERLNLSKEEVMARKLTIGFERIETGESNQLFQDTLNQSDPEDLIRFAKELYREKNFTFAKAILDSSSNNEVVAALQEFENKYKM